MKNDDSIINEKDFKIFSLLNNTEKLEYLYRKELIYRCSNHPRMIEYKKPKKVSVPKVNILIIDKYIVISATNRKAANVTKLRLMEDGFILRKAFINNNYLVKNFNLTYKFNTCYSIAAVDAPLCYN
jgi:hypothetical protein